MTQPQFVPQVPTATTGYGFRTPFGLTLPPGGQVAAFVRSTGAQSNDDPAIALNLMPTLAAGLSRCRPGLGDTVVVLPGHAENVVDNTMLANLVNGTRIVGVGTGSATPTFTWTAAASQWVFDNNDVQVVGCRLNLGGFNGVTNAIAWTGADCVLAECDVNMGTTAALKAVVGITVGAGADRGRIALCDFRGAVAAAVVNGVLISGIVDRFRMTDVDMDFATTVGTVGLVAITAAATAFIGKRLTLHNSLVGSTATLSSAVASTGTLTEVYSNYETTGAGSATNGLKLTGSAIKCFQCFATGTNATNGLLSPVAGAA
jgi:hypothetical protein